MRKNLASLLLALVLCLGLTVPAAAADQKITVGEETYEALLQAIMSETKADAVTVRLDSDVTLTSAVVIGSSDYNGLFSAPQTVTAHNVTIDLNGYTLTAAKDCAVFEVQKDYTLTIVDNSQAKTGKLDCGVKEAVVVAQGATYNALPASQEPPAETTEEKPAGEAPAANPFTDVASDAYYYDPVLWAVGKGITTGRTETTFVPNETCTEANILTFLWRASGEPAAAVTENPFGEAVSADAYYYKAALWAFEKKMIDETFAPNTACTRAQAVYFMWMAAGAPTDAAAAAFTDVAADASYAAAVNWAVAQGVTTGRTETTFAPAETCTRGNIVTFLYRAANTPAGEAETTPAA